MIITNIKQAKKHCFEVVFEDESVLLDKETVVKNGLKVGQALDEADVESLRYDSSVTRATSKAMWLLGRREYSEKEMILRLKKDGFDEDAVVEAVERLVEAGVIDDERFAYNFAYNLKENRKLGKRAVITELLLKGVDREIAEAVADEFCNDEVESAAEIIRIKYPAFNEDEKINRRMFAALQRKGYSYSVIKQATLTVENENMTDID
ncbi:MAG: regulatory protein RecX [Acutalibacteraceae bacterium]